jgi:tetratricopeptide (TPR) repeat protein
MSQMTANLDQTHQRHPRRRSVSGGRALLAVVAVVAVVVGSVVAGSALRGHVEPSPMMPVAEDVQVAPAITTAQQVEALQQRLAADPRDTRSALDLAAVYQQLARETGDPAYYGKSESLLNEVLAREPENAEAMAWLGGLALARHEFAAALDWGEQALVRDDDLLAAFPVVIDALVELGRYDEAVATSDAFIRLRPDLASYTRVSYLRELHGDTAGAIAAMELALDATRFGTEPAAWTRVQLGNLHFHTGDFTSAEEEYAFTLVTYPEYAPALAGLARVAAANGDLERAAELLTQAAGRVPLPEYVILLGDVYAAQGDTASAEEQYDLVRVMTRLQQANGVNTDLELALFAADHPDSNMTPDAVVTMAREAFAARPGIYGHDTLAWALYRAGEYDAAWQESDRALRLGTRDALLHFHAGMIAAARGDEPAAREHLTTALEINPNFSILHVVEAREALARLGG